MSLYHADVLMLKLLVGSTKTGNYKAALKLAEFLWFVPIAIQTVFVHSTSELWSNERHDQISELATRATRYTFLITMVMVVGIASLADIAVPMYFGPEAVPAITPLLLLLPGSLGLALARPILAIGQGKGDLKFPTLATAGAASINFALNLLLIPRYGMHGAAVATSIGYSSMFGFHLWSARRIGFDPLTDARIGRTVLTALLAAGPIFYLPSVIGNDLVTLVVVPVVGGTLYLVAAFITRALGVVELLDVLASFPAPIGSSAERLKWHFDLFT
ncbi:oligosaccharide flippase family protein [Haloarculaceae archaeon H-GB11]|nr:oligosaccharide flippase family protein [Haloarculaceae archaeon H-GB11]